MKPETLSALKDEELNEIIAQAVDLLEERKEQRKAKAIEEARARLAEVGLSFKDVAAKAPMKRPKQSVSYRGGSRYQHPDDKTKVWTAKGQKPNWLRELETAGKRAVELPAEAARG